MLSHSGELPGASNVRLRSYMRAASDGVGSSRRLLVAGAWYSAISTMRGKCCCPLVHARSESGRRSTATCLRRWCFLFTGRIHGDLGDSTAGFERAGRRTIDFGNWPRQ